MEQFVEFIETLRKLNYLCQNDDIKETMINKMGSIEWSTFKFEIENMSKEIEEGFFGIKTGGGHA